jgi:hypothetical protein
MENSNLVVKVKAGSKQAIKDFISYLEKCYYVFPTSSIIYDEDLNTYHIFINVVPRQTVSKLRGEFNE